MVKWEVSEKLPNTTDNWRGVLGTSGGVQSCKAKSTQVTISNTIDGQNCLGNSSRNSTFGCSCSKSWNHWEKKVMGLVVYLGEH